MLALILKIIKRIVIGLLVIIALIYGLGTVGVLITKHQCENTVNNVNMVRRDEVNLANEELKLAIDYTLGLE